MRAQPHVRVVAEELRNRPAPTPPDGMIRTGAAAGAGAGFGGSLLYILCSILFGLAVTNSGSTDTSLLPQTARWVSYLLAFTVYGTVTAVIFGAALGAINGSIQRAMWGSKSPLLSWVVGILLNFVLAVLVHLLLDSRGFSQHLAVELRFVTFPSMLFVLEGGIVGLWISHRAEQSTAPDPVSLD
ncbi:hypothetical protein GCM10011575_04100 [Microlunatus endophyticus]|uniref:Uncharacterized protein n=1 Tax=Microlunatus endophyticus TaxID=1716077 RepID=A0A917S0M0_9ACTN|nr:hypothetical protein [Microlunatus endophyticus]GGL49150.1 hypothetical protein GCM10011575_04100 [Microlunatus endophyticus]